METYDINEIAYMVWKPEAYETAIRNVITALNAVMGTHFFYARDKYSIDKLASDLNIRFDEDGRLVDGKLSA